jgi:hypothetical protein
MVFFNIYHQDEGIVLKFSGKKSLLLSRGRFVPAMGMVFSGARNLVFLASTSISLLIPISSLIALQLAPSDACSSLGPSQKSSVVLSLQNLKARQIEQILKIDSQLKLMIAESQKISLLSIKEGNSLGSRLTSNSVTELSQSLDRLKSSRLEFIARRDIIDQLILQVSSKWTGAGSLKDFLQIAALDLAVIDATADPSEALLNARQPDLSKFYTYLSIALREGYDSKGSEKQDGADDVLAFLENFMTYTSALNPKLPSEFLKDRSYTNGLLSEKARSSNRVEAGDVAADKLSKPGKQL